jgi:hypothetical protein
MTHPGVGALTALVYVLIIGSPQRFHCGKQIGSYLGLILCEDSSAGRQRLGHISKQGNSLLVFCWWRRRKPLSVAMPIGDASSCTWRCGRQRQIAKIAMARKLGVRLYWMWRKGWDYETFLQFGSHVGQPEVGYGVK